MAKCEKFQDLVLGSLERGFTWYGRQVAKYPAVFIVLALILTGICSTGFINWKTEDDGLKLWLPQVKKTLAALPHKILKYPHSFPSYWSAIASAQHQPQL